MGLLRKAINAADRPGSRWALAAGSSAFTKLRGDHLRVHYDDGYWYYGHNGMTLPRGPKFDFYAYDLINLPGRIRHYAAETEDCWFFARSVKPGGVIVDVGAEMGTDAVGFSKIVGPSGTVIAIEAQPDTYQMLLKTISANGLQNVLPWPVAVADKPGTVSISSDAGVESNHLGADGVEVPADTLDNILSGFPSIDYLKMNIEGAEQLAIQGMDETLKKTRFVSIACHDFVADETGNDWFRTRDKVSRYLLDHGFSAVLRDDPRPYVQNHIHATREPFVTLR